MKSRFTTKKIVLVAMLAALTAVSSGIRVKIPVDIAGTQAFHLGNILCNLSGILLGPWMGGLAAGLGSALYDMFDPMYISECWLTFLMKGACGMAAGLVIRIFKNSWGYTKAALAASAGAITYAVLYLAKTYWFVGMFKQGLTPNAALIGVISKIPATVFNAAVAIFFAPVLAVAIRKALKKNHLSLD